MDVHQNKQAWSTYDWPERGDEWSEGWGGAESQWFGCIFPRIHRYLPAARILEIAPGYGRWTQFLKNHCSELFLIDLVPDCIEYCRNRFAQFNHITYHINDGKSLVMIPDGSIDFVFSFDSLVHADMDVIGAYLGQLIYKLTPQGVGFFHHSNFGDYLGQTVANPHGRDSSVSAERFRECCRKVGLICISQEIVNWGQAELIDCLSVFARAGSRWERPNAILRNQNFMREAAFLKSTAPLYSDCGMLRESQRVEKRKQDSSDAPRPAASVSILPHPNRPPVGEQQSIVSRTSRIGDALEFSVVIPVYNHGRYVKQAVMSVLRSPLVSEVLLVDDGSTDNTRVVLAELAARNPTRIRDLTGKIQGNRGANNRLNELVDAARCSRVAVLNADDLFVDGRFEAIVSDDRFTQSDFLFGNLLLMDDSGKLIGAKRGPFDTGVPFPAEFDVKSMVENGNLLDLLSHQNYLGTTGNMVFTKELHARIGGFAAFRYIHDWDFALRAMILSRCTYIRRYFTAYRVHPGNWVNEGSEKVAAEVRTLFDRLLADFPHLMERPFFRIGLQKNANLTSTQAVQIMEASRAASA